MEEMMVNNIEEVGAKKVTVDIRNKVEVVGCICTEIDTHSTAHTTEKLSEFEISIPRVNSEVFDCINVIVPERCGANIKDFKNGDQVRIKGQVRSINQKIEGTDKNKHITIIFAEEMIHDSSSYKVNEVRLRGHICKVPRFRTTPTGRNICDLFVAVDRNYNRCDYIPCISWGRDAKFSSNLEMGDGVFLEGRIQSRTYKKRLSDTEYEERVAYEVSISDIKQIDDSEKVTETYYLDED